MSNLALRSITGLVFAAAMIGAFWWGPTATAILFLLWTFVGSHEFYQLTGASSHRAWGGILLGVGFYIYFFLIGSGVLHIQHLVYLLPILVLLIGLELVVLRPHFAMDFARVLMGWVYVALPMSLVSSYAFIPGEYSFWLPMSFFALLWINDSGAYAVGRAFGKTKLFEKVSPKKTWEGFIGGLIATVLCGLIFSQIEVVQYELVLMTTSDWVVLAILVSVFGTIGDLVESHLKRTANVKDSGVLIPGHGGVLDRFDGYLLAMPMAYTFVYIIYHL
ncbi:MAG: hypothetical protein RL521_610 [Bacteroidota bacterium]|jgi:phosphatidate cytidylyltransferase